MKTKLSYSRWDWPVAVLLIVLVYSTAARLSITAWTPSLWSVEGVSVLGTILGLALGISQFNKTSRRWLVAGYSLIFLTWVLTSTMDGEKTTIGQLASLLGRLGVVIETAARGAPIKDSLFFITLMCLLFWLIGIFSGASAMRNPNIFRVILPSMIPLLVVQYYDGIHVARLWMLGFYFLLAIILIGRLNLLRNRERWKEKRVFSGNEPEFDLGRGLLITAFILIAVAWSFPTPAAAVPAVARVWKKFTEPFQNTRDRLDDLLASLQGGVTAVPGELYGNAMSLGQNALQGDAEIFRVTPVEFTTLRHYWRVRVYDTYTNGRWSVSSTDNVDYSPESDSPLDPGIAVDQNIEYIFSWKTNATSILVTPNYPISASRDSSYQKTKNVEDYDLLSWMVAPPVLAGDQYRVQAAQLNPTIKDLRAAAPEYPKWIADRYLDLPANLSNDIRNLSQRLTSDQATNYDKTLAITNYLRSEMEYNLTVSPPPPGIDPIDWFLFTWKSGFCNYYASAEVLLLRAAGIPARMVVGYAPGTHQADGSYKISAKDAHAWPEVYFSGIGWIEFEPTASQDVIYRPSGEERNAEDDEYLLWRQERLARVDGEDRLAPDGGGPPVPLNPASGLEAVSTPLARWQWVIILATIILGAAFAFWRVEQKYAITQKMPRAVKNILIRYHLNTPQWLDYWVRWSEITSVERAFHAINQALGWLGKPQPQNVTALERAALLKELLPVSAEMIDILVTAHEKTLYTSQPDNPTAATRAAWQIRYQALYARVQRVFNGE